MLNLRTCLNLALAWALPVVLAACGGGTDSATKAHVRLVNSTSGYSALGLSVASNVVASGVAALTSTAYADTSRGTPTLEVTSPSSATVLLSRSDALGKDDYYTLLAYGKAGALATHLLNDNQSAPDTNKTLVRVINTAPDAGSLDVYLTGANDALAQSAPLQTSAAYGALGAFVTINSGIWRLRVVAAGVPTDVRLDIQGQSFGSKAVQTLVIGPAGGPGSGGVLVNALLLTQQGAALAAFNPQARVRVVAGLSSNAVVTASVAGTTLLSNASSPALTDYFLVTAGASPPVVTVNGSAVGFASVPTLAAGGDYTVVVYGAPGAAFGSVTADDNALPSDSSKVKLRLLNGLSSPLTLKLGLVVKASGVASGAGSAYFAADASTTASFNITSADQLVNFSAADQVLLANGVYSYFMLGSASAPRGQLNRDR
jgi:hypothetical protein